MWFTAASWIGLALVASLISIRTGISVAVVYAVMIETRLNETDLGKLMLAACPGFGLPFGAPRPKRSAGMRPAAFSLSAELRGRSYHCELGRSDRINGG